MTDIPIIFSAPMVQALLDGRKTMTRRLAFKPYWHLAAKRELPETFRDPRCEQFRCICSNGFEGDLSIGSAFVHKPRSYPQCFPGGEDSDAVCTSVFVRRRSTTWQTVKPGDKLWVRENWRVGRGYDGVKAGDLPTPEETPIKLWHEATPELYFERSGKLRPSIFMPRWASRLTLTVKATKIEPLHAITEADALAEGIICYDPDDIDDAEYAYREGGVIFGSAVEAFAALWIELHGTWNLNPEVVALTFEVHKQNIDALKEAA